MKEQPIIFTAESVQAILAGRSQTRRVVALGTEFGPSDTPGYDWTFRGTRRGGTKGSGACCWQDLRHAELLELCPYGGVGSVLWCRESFCLFDDGRYGGLRYDDGTEYHCPAVPLAADDPNAWWDVSYRKHGERRQPSIHMPRWASRLTLTVTDVRVERLQEITEADALAEGYRPFWGEPYPDPLCRMGILMVRDAMGAADAFRLAWDEVNARRPGWAWAESPWVWVVTFVRVDVP